MVTFSRRSRSTPPRRATDSGFTLIELLVTIAIIGTLAGVAIAVYSSATNTAQNMKTIDSVTKYRKALISYAILNHSYPTTTNGNAVPQTSGSACLGETGPCFDGTLDLSFNNALRPFLGSTLPSPDDRCLLMYSSCRYGAAFNLKSAATLDGAIYPYGITYVLGGSATCGGAGLLGGSWMSFTTTPNVSGFIERHQGTTLCRVLLPDPATL